jgi:hypothetical protein
MLVFMKRQVIIDPGEDGYWVAECPSLPACISQGKTKEESIARFIHYLVSHESGNYYISC